MFASRPVMTGALIVLFYLLLYIAPLDMRPLIMPDETRYSQVPREMLASGSWLSPRFDGMPYFEKPSAGYWPAMLSMKVLGESRFSARLPQALATGVSALLLFLLIRRGRKGDQASPLMAAAVFLASSEVFLVGSFAVLDSVFSMFLTGALTFFYYAWTEDSSAFKKQLFVFIAGLFAGAAFMTKGPLGFLIPGAAVGAFLIWMKDWKTFVSLPLAGLAGAALVAVPWIVAQNSAEPDFWRYFIVNEHLSRFAGDSSERHPQPFWFYLPVLLGGLMPFTMFGYSVVRGATRLDWKSPLSRFLAVWTIVPFVALSFSSGKLGTYILPLFPPLAMLVSACLREAVDKFGAKGFNIVAKTLAIVFAAAAASLLVWHFAAPKGLQLFSWNEPWKFILGLFALAFAATMFLLAAKRAHFDSKVGLLCIAPMGLMLCWHLAMPDLFDGMKAPEEFISSCAKRISPETKLIASADMAGSACWVLKRDDADIFRKPGEFDYGLKKTPSRKLVSPEELRAMIEKGDALLRLAVFMPARYEERFFSGLKIPSALKVETLVNGELACMLVAPTP